MPYIYCDGAGQIQWNDPSFQNWTKESFIDLWRLPVNAESPILSYNPPVLNSEELEKSRRYLKEADRMRFVISRTALRILLGRYLDREPQDIPLFTGPNKKPSVQVIGGRQLHCNIAHSGDWILIAVSDSPVGVDLEKINDRFSYEEILPVSFSPGEVSAIQHARESRSVFFLLWTRKEALTKATGKGLDSDMVLVPCLDGRHEVESSLLGSPDNWKVSSFTFEELYCASLAGNPGLENIVFWDLRKIPW